MSLHFDLIECYDNGGVRQSNTNDNYKLYNLFENPEEKPQHDDQDSTYVIDYFQLPSCESIDYDAQRSLTIENASGNSELSEAYSIEYFSKVFSAYDFVLEMEVEYWISYKMVDFLCKVQNRRIGVSVTRAMYKEGEFTKEMALELLNKKIYGLIVSRNGVIEKHSFDLSFLHIWCQSEEIALGLVQAYKELDIYGYELEITGSLMLMLTICSSPTIYYNKFKHCILDGLSLRKRNKLKRKGRKCKGTSGKRWIQTI